MVPVRRFVAQCKTTLKYARPRGDSPLLEHVAFPNETKHSTKETQAATLCSDIKPKTNVLQMFLSRGGGTQVQRGAAPAVQISRKKGSFLGPPHVRDFVKEGYFFVPRYEVWGGGGGVKIPLQSTKYTRLRRRMTPEVTGLPSLLPPLAAAKRSDEYKI